MSKQIILDIIALVALAVFLVMVYQAPSLKEDFMKILCNPELAKMAPVICTNWLFILYFIPFISASWLLVRVCIKITKSV